MLKESFGQLFFLMQRYLIVKLVLGTFVQLFYLYTSLISLRIKQY